MDVLPVAAIGRGEVNRFPLADGKAAERTVNWTSKETRQSGFREPSAMLVKLTRFAVGNEYPAALDKATDLGGLPRPERDRMRQYEEPIIATEIASPDLVG